MNEQSNKIIIAISGASGAIYGIRLLEILQSCNIETHLIISKAALLTIIDETDYSIDKVKSLASFNYLNTNIAASIASGSYQHSGMIIAPCSIKTMSQIASGNCDNLITRAADVSLKERRKLVLMVRETPLHLGHLRTMTSLAEMGAIIAPPMPAFYCKPQSIDDLVNQTVGRVLDLFNINTGITKRWSGLNQPTL